MLQDLRKVFLLLIFCHSVWMLQSIHTSNVKAGTVIISDSILVAMVVIRVINWCLSSSQNLKMQPRNLSAEFCMSSLGASRLTCVVLLPLRSSLHLVPVFSHPATRFQVQGNVCFFLKSMWAAKPWDCYVIKLLLAGRRAKRRGFFSFSLPGSPPPPSLSVCHLFPHRHRFCLEGWGRSVLCTGWIVVSLFLPQMVCVFRRTFEFTKALCGWLLSQVKNPPFSLRKKQSISSTPWFPYDLHSEGDFTVCPWIICLQE